MAPAVDKLYQDQFSLTPITYTILNGCNEVVEPQFNSEVISAPPTDVVGPKPALDADGDPIPGTVVIHDLVDAENEVYFNAKKAVIHILGLDVASGRCGGVYYNRGLAYLPPTPTKEVIARVRQQAGLRANKARLEAARAVIAAHEQLNEARKRWGAPAMPVGEDYLAAVKVLNSVGLALEPVKTAAAETLATSAEPEIPVDDEGLKAFAKAKFEVLASETATELGDPDMKDKLVEAMLADEDSVKIAKEQYKQERRRSRGA